MVVGIGPDVKSIGTGAAVNDESEGKEKSAGNLGHEVATITVFAGNRRGKVALETRDLAFLMIVCEV